MYVCMYVYVCIYVCIYVCMITLIVVLSTDVPNVKVNLSKVHVVDSTLFQIQFIRLAC